MPTYEYKCDACGNLFEKFQPITSDPIKKCPKCGKNKVRRLISAGAGLIFKGSGFYITDYRDKGYSESAKADSAASNPTPSADKPKDGSSESSKPDPGKSETGKPDSAKPAASDGKPADTAAEKPAPKESAARNEPKASKSARKK